MIGGEAEFELLFVTFDNMLSGDALRGYSTRQFGCNGGGTWSLTLYSLQYSFVFLFSIILLLEALIYQIG